jgi:signal transduction histidine kinase
LGHDLRTPLNVIILTAENHERVPDAREPCREAGKRITTSAGRMSRLIEDVVDFTRSRLGGGLPIERKPAHMGKLCLAPLDEIRTISPTSNISVHVEGDVNGSWDPDRVLQVVANLAGNAAMHGDGNVQVTVRDAGDEVILEVHNGGPLIPAHKMEHLFEPFHPGGQRREGLGLGLYIVEQIVRAHGGMVSAVSTQAAGTTFTVRWPRNTPTSAPLARTGAQI